MSEYRSRNGLTYLVDRSAGGFALYVIDKMGVRTRLPSYPAAEHRAEAQALLDDIARRNDWEPIADHTRLIAWK